MSLRSGNNKKKGQKHQNTYSFRHNKSSMISRKLASSPLDFLCERCLVKLQWRLQFQKYKPLTNASRCNICKEKKIYKAYRTICESCALKDGYKNTSNVLLIAGSFFFIVLICSFIKRNILSPYYNMKVNNIRMYLCTKRIKTQIKK